MTRKTVVGGLLYVAAVSLCLYVGVALSRRLDIPHTQQQDRAYYDSEGVFHDSVSHQKAVAAFVRDNHCVCVDHTDQGARLDQGTLKVTHPAGYSTYRCPGIQNVLNIDDNEVQP